MRAFKLKWIAKEGAGFVRAVRAFLLYSHFFSMLV